MTRAEYKFGHLLDGREQIHWREGGGGEYSGFRKGGENLKESLTQNEKKLVMFYLFTITMEHNSIFIQTTCKENRIVAYAMPCMTWPEVTPEITCWDRNTV